MEQLNTWKMRTVKDAPSFTGNRPYPLRIGLLLSNKAVPLLNDLIKEHAQQLDHFFEFTNSYDKFTCTSICGGKFFEGKILPTSKYWATRKITYIDHYKNNVVPLLYPFLGSIDNEECYRNRIRFLFIEIGITLNSVFVKGEYTDNPLGFQLKTTIWGHEHLPI